MPSGECSIEPWVFMNWRRAAYYLAEVIDAKRALEVGLVNEVVSREELDARVDAIARHIAQAPLTTLMATKSEPQACVGIDGRAGALAELERPLLLSPHSAPTRAPLFSGCSKTRWLAFGIGSTSGRGSRIHRPISRHRRGSPVNIVDQHRARRGAGSPQSRPTATPDGWRRIVGRQKVLRAGAASPLRHDRSSVYRPPYDAAGINYAMAAATALAPRRSNAARSTPRPSYGSSRPIASRTRSPPRRCSCGCSSYPRQFALLMTCPVFSV